jgi:hypothetical protein
VTADRDTREVRAAAEDGPNSASAVSARSHEYERVMRARTEHLVHVEQPLVLVSQAPRSGGTLLMRLLDGHPQCHTMPHEISVNWGRPTDLLQGSDHAWDTLVPRNLDMFFRRGFKQSKASLSGTRDFYPFLLPPAFQRRIFEVCVARHERPTERDIVNAYMTSYFNAWLDNQNLYEQQKRWITAFAPRLSMNPRYRGRLKELYPDGRLISIIRDPRSWYASAREWSLEWHRLETAIGYWREAAELTLELHEELDGRFHVLTFEDLVARTPATMRALAKALGLRFTSQMCEPTFNRMPIKANSSYAVEDTSVMKRPLTRYRDVLESRDIAKIESLAGDLYTRVARLALRPVEKRQRDGQSRPTRREHRPQSVQVSN